jgi:Domain of unknown function (DUF4158)
MDSQHGLFAVRWPAGAVEYGVGGFPTPRVWGGGRADQVPLRPELARLTGWPAEIADADLVTLFSPTSEDLRWPHEAHRGSDSRLGLSMQLCALPWLGWVPDDLTGCPPPARCCRDTHDCGARRV